ncbi:NACHT domain-containing protein [Streptomyces sp. NPDC003077]|uniref:NACHT domain-containing protein n=1 Tax=Streptomyces sp. NPDC003077 TaxID=3154443 RepID=UPI00339E7858
MAGPLVRKLFVKDGPGAGLVDKPVRISGLLSFKGEKRTLTEKDVHKLAAELVARAVRTGAPGERPVPADEETAIAEALARTLHGLGDLDMDDLQAVQLGAPTLAARLRETHPLTTSGLSTDSLALHDELLHLACLHIVHFFTQRSTFVDRTLVQQSHDLNQLITRIDTFIERHPSPLAADTAFERDYLRYIARKHNRLTIYGIDLGNSPDRWPLDAAYMSLEATTRRPPEAEPFADPMGPFTTPLSGAPLPADQALAGEERVLLRGVAGSGKSTLVQWMAVSCTRPAAETPLPHLYGRIPFVLPLRTLTRSGAALPTPDRFLTTVGCPLAGAQPHGWAERTLTSGRGLLLIDGLDEIPEREREQTRRWLRDLLDAFPHNLWMVTSRPSAVREDWLATDDFRELTLSSMSHKDVAAFVHRWHTAARADTPEDTDRLDAYEQTLLTAIRTKQDLGRLATNPLMCGLICALHRDRRGYLPHGRKELYDAALSMLLSRRDRERDMPCPDGIELSDEPQIQLLQRLAYWLIRNGRTELARERAVRIIADALPAVPSAAAQGDAEAVFRHLLARSGLLREPTPGAVDFVHRTFQDYLGAKAAVDEWDIGLLVRHSTDTQWEDVIRMAIAHSRPRERAEILEALLTHGDKLEETTDRLRVHLLAMASLEHATELDPRIRGEVESRAGAILPPRSYEEAKLLADAGPLVLELLPGPDGLMDDEAEHTVNTICLIGTDAGLEKAKLFRNHSARGAQSVLARAWHRFDTETYAEEIIRHLPHDPDRPIGVRSLEELALLRSLGRQTWTEINGAFTAQELREYLDPAQLSNLRLEDNPVVDRLDFLRDFPKLKEANFWRCPKVDDVTPLGDIPLQTLFIGGSELHDLPRGLSELSTLKTLFLGQSRLTAASLHRLPARAPMEYLSFGGPAEDELPGLSAWPTLRGLLIGELPTGFGAATWREIASLPRLHSLGFRLTDDCPVPTIPYGLQMPQVHMVHVLGLKATDTGLIGDVLQSVVSAFPKARELYLSDDLGRAINPLDISPLSALTDLRKVHLSYLVPDPPISLPNVKIALRPRLRSALVRKRHLKQTKPPQHR